MRRAERGQGILPIAGLFVCLFVVFFLCPFVAAKGVGGVYALNLSSDLHHRCVRSLEAHSARRPAKRREGPVTHQPSPIAKRPLAARPPARGVDSDRFAHELGSHSFSGGSGRVRVHAATSVGETSSFIRCIMDAYFSRTASSSASILRPSSLSCRVCLLLAHVPELASALLVDDHS